MNWRLISQVLVCVAVFGCATVGLQSWGGPGRFVGPVPGHPAGAWPYRRIEA